MFTTKAFIVPHLQVIMCGTGMGGFLGKWFVEVNDRMVVRGIDHLDSHTPTTLATFWRKFRDEYSISESLTTTVYHFGFSEEDNLIHRYAYRSANNFVSETLPYGVGIKPECQSSRAFQFPADIKTIMDEQRAIQRSRPRNERVYIGGKIQVHHLTKAGYNVYVRDQFEDFELTQEVIYRNYDSQKQDP